MNVPEAMTGAWERVSLTLDGGPEQDTTEVRWLQAEELFADLRIERTDGAVKPYL